MKGQKSSCGNFTSILRQNSGWGWTCLWALASKPESLSSLELGSPTLFPGYQSSWMPVSVQAALSHFRDSSLTCFAWWRSDARCQRAEGASWRVFQPEFEPPRPFYRCLFWNWTYPGKKSGATPACSEGFRARTQSFYLRRICLL